MHAFDVSKSRGAVGRGGRVRERIARARSAFSYAFFCTRCVNLVAELSRLPLATQDVLSALPLLADSCNARHYQQHFSFLETTWKQVGLRTI